MEVDRILHRFYVGSVGGTELTIRIVLAIKTSQKICWSDMILQNTFV